MVTTSVTLRGGVEMPMVGLGTWQATGPQGYGSTLRALEAGYRHIDTATKYGNEAEVGRALRDSGVAREEVFLTTKLPPQRAGHEREVLAASLEALGTDHVDLWLVHWPPSGSSVPVWEAFVAAHQDGMARAIGVSNYDVREIDEITAATGERPVVNQVRWAPALHDPGRLAAHVERDVVVEGYSPFTSTDLRDPVLTGIAAAHGVATTQVVLRWHLQHGIVVIPKSVTPERITSNLDVYGFALTPGEMVRIDGLSSIST